MPARVCVCVCVLTAVVDHSLFTKLVLEAPVITESALEVIRRYCEDEVRDGVLQIVDSDWSKSKTFVVCCALCSSPGCIWA